MSKIGFIVPLYLNSQNHGGATKTPTLLAKNFQNLGHEVEMLIPWAEDFRSVYNPFIKDKNLENEIVDNLKIKRFKLRWYKNIPNIIFRLIFKIRKKYFKSSSLNKFFTFIGPHFKKIEDYIIQENFDVIHINCFPYYYMLEIPKNLRKKGFKGKIVLSPYLHCEKIDWINPVFQESLNLADIVHSQTNYEIKYLNKNYQIKKNKLWMVPAGIQDEEYLINEFQKPNYHQIIMKLKIEKKIIILGIFSKREKNKGMQETIQALSKIYRKDIVYLVLGGDKKTLKYKNIKIHILGRVSWDFKNYLFSICDIFCMPSATESFGLVYLEAWNYKKPIIALDSPQMKELFQEGGLFAKPNSINSLTMCLKKLIENEHLRTKLGENGFDKLQKNFLLRNLIKDYLKMFLNN